MNMECRFLVNFTLGSVAQTRIRARSGDVVESCMNDGMRNHWEEYGSMKGKENLVEHGSGQGKGNLR